MESLGELALTAAPEADDEVLETVSRLPVLARAGAICRDLDSKYQFEQKLPFHPNSDFIRVYVNEHKFLACFFLPTRHRIVMLEHNPARYHKYWSKYLQHMMGFEEFAVINTFYGLNCITDLVLCSSAVITDPCKCAADECRCRPIVLCPAGPRCELARITNAGLALGTTVQALGGERKGHVGVIQQRLDEGQRFVVFWTKDGTKTEEDVGSIQAVYTNYLGAVVDGELHACAGRRRVCLQIESQLLLGCQIGVRAWFSCSCSGSGGVIVRVFFNRF